MVDQRTSRRAWLFFVLAFSYAWLLWLPSVLSGWGVAIPWNLPRYSGLVIWVGSIAPALAALTLVLRSDGWRGVRAFLAHATDYHTAPVFLLLALGLPLLIHGLSHLLALALDLPVAAPVSGFPATLSPIPAILLGSGPAPTSILPAIPWLLLLMLVGALQEYGWREYVQDTLEQRMGLLAAGLVTGVLWGLWHLPLWVGSAGATTGVPLGAFLVTSISVSVVSAWLYRASGRKVLVAMLFSAMNVAAAPVLPYLHGQGATPELAVWLYALLNVGFAAAIGARLILEPPRPLSSRT